MIYPTLNSENSSRSVINVFGGYNHNLRISENEFYDMTNLSSDHYPLLSSRGKRGCYALLTDGQGIISKDAVYYVDDGVLYKNRAPVVGLELTKGEKTLISMGAYLLIFPDKKYYNTEDGSKGDIESEIRILPSDNASVAFTPCDIDGNEISVQSETGEAPDDPSNADYWLDTSQNPKVLYQYSSYSQSWVQIATTYIKITYAKLGTTFSQYDGVKISGISNAALTELNGSHIIWSVPDENSVVVVGLLSDTVTISGGNEILICRRMPEFDFITEAGNRLWACKYGQDSEKNVVNEIYASKLGDFKNWNCFMGISTDSYVASLGSDGAFTGAVTHLGYPIFFKENCIHKVYGEMPSNFQIQTTACRGVQKGSGKSLSIVNGILFYKGISSVVAYDGSLPSELSDVFGEKRYGNAVGCAHGSKYYLSMSDSEGKYHLFVYDTAKGLWHREDETAVLGFCSVDNELYYIDKADNMIKTVSGSGEKLEGTVVWSAESGIIGTDSIYHKYLSKIIVRMSLDAGACVRAYIEYDSSGHFEYAGSVTGKTLDSFSLPIRPRRCDHLRIRFTGSGGVKIYSITKTIEEGSDRL